MKQTFHVKNEIPIIGDEHKDDLESRVELKFVYGSHPLDNSTAGRLAVNEEMEKAETRENLDASRHEGHLLLSYAVSDEQIGEVTFGLQFEAYPGKGEQSVDGHNLHLAEFNNSMRRVLENLLPEDAEVYVDFAGRPCPADKLGLDYDIPKIILDRGVDVARAREMLRENNPAHGHDRDVNLEHNN